MNVAAAVATGLALSAAPAFALEKTAACPDVFGTLERLQKVIPTLRGDDGALSRSFLLMVATKAEDASGKVQFVGWSDGSAQALQNLGQSARTFMNGGLSPGQATLNQFLSYAGVVAGEAATICPQSIPQPAAAG